MHDGLVFSHAFKVKKSFILGWGVWPSYYAHLHMYWPSSLWSTYQEPLLDGGFSFIRGYRLKYELGIAFKTHTELSIVVMYSAIFLSALLASVACAHSEAGNSRNGLPKIMGGSRFNANLKNRNIFEYTQARDSEAGSVTKRSPVVAGTRTKNPRAQSCGAGVGSCPAGYCCSLDG
jgi:hypothetical protein